MFDTGNWEWTVKQRFIKEPRIKLNDILTILDEVKAEIIASEEEGEGTVQDGPQPSTQPETS